MSHSLALMDGWEQFYDDAQQAYYYHNAVTGETQWDPPDPDTANTSADTSHAPEPYERLTALPVLKKPKALPPLKIDVTSVQMHSTTHHNFKFGIKRKGKKVYCDVSDAPDVLAGMEYGAVDDEKYSDMDESDEVTHKLATQTDKLSFSSVPPSVMSTHSASLTPMPVGGLSQDYLALARTYKLQRPYSDIHVNLSCVLCNKNTCSSVFFPCQHRCVCDECIASECLCTDTEMRRIPKGFCNCPLCAGIIKKILPFEGGAEEEKYWQWVMEVSPELPQGFMRNFRHSAAVIEKLRFDIARNLSRGRWDDTSFIARREFPGVSKTSNYISGALYSVDATDMSDNRVLLLIAVLLERGEVIWLLALFNY